MKKYFWTGLVILLPISLTLFIIFYLFDLFTAPFYKLIETLVLKYEATHQLQLLYHENLVIFLSRLIVLVLLVLLIFALGFLGQRYFFKQFLKFFNQIVLRIPFLGAIYRLTKDVTKAFFKADDKTFKQTVLVPFPTSDSKALGFITGNVPEPFKALAPEVDLSVFVPTAPHPISGFMLLVPKHLVSNLDISVEEGFKFLLSCGVIHPGQNPQSSQEEKP